MFAELRAEGCFPIDFFETQVVFDITGITPWWTLVRMQV